MGFDARHAAAGLVSFADAHAGGSAAAVTLAQHGDAFVDFLFSFKPPQQQRQPREQPRLQAQHARRAPPAGEGGLRAVCVGSWQLRTLLRPLCMPCAPRMLCAHVALCVSSAAGCLVPWCLRRASRRARSRNNSHSAAAAARVQAQPAAGGAGQQQLL